jgi:rubrerythrin
MIPVEALKLALAKEEASITLYKNIAIEHKALKDLCDELISEEFKHKKLIEAKIRELTKY